MFAPALFGIGDSYNMCAHMTRSLLLALSTTLLCPSALAAQPCKAGTKEELTLKHHQ